MPLSIVKRDNKELRIPDGKAIQAALEVSGYKAEALAYLSEQAKKNGNINNELCQELERMAMSAQTTQTAYDGQDVHGGVAPKTEFQLLQAIKREQSMDVIDYLKNAQIQLEMVYAVNAKDSAFLRAYAIAEHSINASDENESIIIDKIDALSKEWMALHGIFNHNGKLYASDEHGRIEHDENGRPIQISSEEFNALMEDPKEGFATYAKQFGAKVVTTETEFPVDQTAKVEAAKQTPEETAKKEQASETKASDPAPDAPPKI